MKAHCKFLIKITNLHLSIFFGLKARNYFLTKRQISFEKFFRGHGGVYFFKVYENHGYRRIVNKIDSEPRNPA